MLNGSSKKNVFKKIFIKPSGKYPFSILGFWVQKGENIKVDFKNISDKENGWVLIVTNTKKQSGKYFDQIVLKTDHSEIPEVILRVRGDITDRQILNNRPPNDDDGGPPIYDN